jgi:hypothetical protein
MRVTPTSRILSGKKGERKLARELRKAIPSANMVDTSKLHADEVIE